jgi:hypothetical protein
MMSTPAVARTELAAELHFQRALPVHIRVVSALPRIKSSASAVDSGENLRIARWPLRLSGSTRVIFVVTDRRPCFQSVCCEAATERSAPRKWLKDESEAATLQVRFVHRSIWWDREPTKAPR